MKKESGTETRGPSDGCNFPRPFPLRVCNFLSPSGINTFLGPVCLSQVTCALFWCIAVERRSFGLIARRIYLSLMLFKNISCITVCSTLEII